MLIFWQNPGIFSSWRRHRHGPRGSEGRAGGSHRRAGSELELLAFSMRHIMHIMFHSITKHPQAQPFQHRFHGQLTIKIHPGTLLGDVRPSLRATISSIMKRYKILILDDKHAGVQHLHKALHEAHDVVWTRTIAEAMQQLKYPDHFEVIICGTHLFNESMFEFLKQVKATADHAHIPFICFRSGNSDFARANDSQLEYTSQIMGANGYIVATNATDSDSLRLEIEEVLKPLVRQT